MSLIEAFGGQRQAKVGDLQGSQVYTVRPCLKNTNKSDRSVNTP